ncbi:MAG: hypothetical protein MRERV_6c044 [Mycoplasmataceae bacterium RV_VA103A]|nr:MAG: hypothetical protein MRERV_6c044 [Mycoplasmataceae bacterium RV_VA103A]
MIKMIKRTKKYKRVKNQRETTKEKRPKLIPKNFPNEVSANQISIRSENKKITNKKRTIKKLQSFFWFF